MNVRRIIRSALAGLVPIIGVVSLAQAPRSVVVAAPTQPGAVSVPANFNHSIGCSGDWQPDCAQAQLTRRPDDVWSVTLNLPGGSYLYKAALDKSWTVNYGAGAVRDGGNISLDVPAGGRAVTFYYDNLTHWITDDINSRMATAVGDFQTKLGCPSDFAPVCLRSWLEDPDGDGIYTFSTASIPAGQYRVKAALDQSSTVEYGAGGTAGGPSIAFTVPADGDVTTFSYDSTTHEVNVISRPLVQPPPSTFGHPTAARGDVLANLFEWNWPSVARECTDVLGPAGYGGVQVAPPQDSLSNSSGHPWWEVYQPVDYSLTSRMGNESQFVAMVSTCRAAGVKVYVDTVINHMSASVPSGTSYGGVSFSKYLYPGLYTAADFHEFPVDCPQPDNQIHDYNNYTEVTHCELVGLPDLRTESTTVRSTLVGYLNKLLGYGVSGFRVDAAKHIGESDLAAIEAGLNKTVDGDAPYVALEVMPGGSGQLQPSAFEGEGSLLGFDFTYAVASAFRGQIANLRTLDTSGLLPGDKELVFVQNHDTAFGGGISYKDGPINSLATEFMLAYGHGTPQVFASFVWTNNNDSPPASASGFVTDTDCSNGWACSDRSIGTANMVDWHDYVAGTPVTNWYDDGTNFIAFSRGSKGWIAINKGNFLQTRTFTTGLPPGIYCDVIHGTYNASLRGSCSGPTVTVDSQGKAVITVAPLDAVAFDAGDLLSASPTAAVVGRFTAIRRGSSVTFNWRMRVQAGVVGFDLFAGKLRLNSRPIPVHSAVSYSVRIRTRLNQRFVLGVRLATGRELRVAAG